VEGDAAGEIGLAGRQDGDEAVVEADVARVHDHVDGLKVHERVAVEPFHQLGRSEHVGRHRLSLEEALAAVRHGARGDEVHEGVREEGRVNAEVLLFPEMTGQGLVDGPDGEGQAAPVLDNRGHVRGDPVIGVRHGPAGQVDRGLPGLDEEVEVVDVHEGVADRPGDPGVDLRHDERGVLHGMPRHVDA